MGATREKWATSALAEPLSREELQAELHRAKPGAASSPQGRLTLNRWVPPSPASGSRLQLRHSSCRSLLNDPSLALRLFYGAPISELQRLLDHGFDQPPDDPYGLAAYGRGWYFSKYATHAQHYTSGGNALLLVEVAVGNTETVVRRDARRGAPSAGFDAMVIPGRRLPSAAGLSAAGGGAGGGEGEEYVVFDGSQALPLCLVFFDE